VSVIPTAGTRLLPLGRLEAFSDGVFAIAITLLVIELHVPTGQEGLVAGLEHEWPRYLGYLVSFAFIGGVWMAHSNLTSFIRAMDAPLMRLNLLLLLLVSLLPFTTAVVATHLFTSFHAFDDATSLTLGAERLAVVLFGANLTLAALTIYLVIRHAARAEGIPLDAAAEGELRGFSAERRLATWLQGAATLLGVLLPILAVVFYLSVSLFFIAEPFRLTLRRASRR
jgi:uncharacterized membrane protein